MRKPLARWLIMSTMLSLSTTLIASTEKSLEIKTVPGIHFFYGEYSLSNKNMHKQGDKIAEKTAYTIATKTPTVLSGPFTYIFENVESFDPSTINAQIGWPVEKSIEGVGSYQFKEVKPLKSVSYIHEGAHTELPNKWKKLITQAIAEGHKITGEGRTLIRLSGANGDVVAELQLGIQ